MRCAVLSSHTLLCDARYSHGVCCYHMLCDARGTDAAYDEAAEAVAEEEAELQQVSTPYATSLRCLRYLPTLPNYAICLRPPRQCPILTPYLPARSALSDAERGYGAMRSAVLSERMAVPDGARAAAAPHPTRET
eukprot:3564995-Rhodomonas_salina.1